MFEITGTIVRTDGYTETQTAAPSLHFLSFAFETTVPRGGTYNVKVTKAGYQDWQANDVVVTRMNECFMRTVSLEAAMVPL